MLRVDIITLFPDLFTLHLQTLPIKKALAKKLLEINFHQLRNFAVDKRGTVDDKPYGGGPGMILMVQPIVNALEGIQKCTHTKVVVLTPQGRRFSQKIAQEYSKNSHLVLVCGRYEGIDQRVIDNFSNDTLSIGDYVLSGGELPALVVLESIARLLPGVLEKPDAPLKESFSAEGEIEYPQYTRPENFMGHKVPQVLLSGNHKKTEEWRRKNTTALPA